jgi:hypothetical protein
MNLRQLHSLRATSLLARPHVHGGVTRRQFLQGSALALAGSAALGRGNAVAAKRPKVPADPRPIPYGTHFLGPEGPLFHVQAPGYPIPGLDTDPATNDPSTITDFNGFVGIAFVGGQGTRRDRTTGQTASLYWEVDMRFMVGTYVGVDGRHHRGTFGFI